MGNLVKVESGLWQPTKNEVEIITKSICPGASRDELAWFLNVCKNSGLNPIKGQIFMLVTNSKKYGKKVNVYTSLAGYLLIARESGTFDGFDGPWYFDEDGTKYEVLPKGKNLHAVRVEARVKGVSRPFVGCPTWDEFGQPNVKYYTDRETGEQVPSNNWAKMPIHMLTKVAYSHALRKAYPDRLSAVPVEDELGMSAEEFSKYTVRVSEDDSASPPPPPQVTVVEGKPPAPTAAHEAPVDNTPTEQQDPVQAELEKAKNTFESLAAEYAGDSGTIMWDVIKRVLSEIGEFPWKQKYPRYEEWDAKTFADASRYIEALIEEDASQPVADDSELLAGLDL